MTLTRQQIFDEALTIARSQNKPCMNDRGWNLFHHEKLRSFTGSWIPIDIGHDVEINGMDTGDYVRAFPEIFKITDEEFICDLEHIHDDYEVDEWESKLESFAEAYRLVYQPKESMKWQQRRQLSMHLRAS